jgi:hypothetical protein
VADQLTVPSGSFLNGGNTVLTFRRFVEIAACAAVGAGPRYFQAEWAIDMSIAGVFAGLGQTAESGGSLGERLATLRVARRCGWPPEAHAAALAPLIEDPQPGLDQLDATLESVISRLRRSPEAVPDIESHHLAAGRPGGLASAAWPQPPGPGVSGYLPQWCGS